MKRPRNRAADYLVYLAVRLIVGVAQAMTIEQSYAFAGLLANILYRVDKRHRNVGLENLRLAFGDQLQRRSARCPGPRGCIGISA